MLGCFCTSVVTFINWHELKRQGGTQEIAAAAPVAAGRSSNQFIEGFAQQVVSELVVFFSAGMSRMIEGLRGASFTFKV